MFVVFGLPYYSSYTSGILVDDWDKGVGFIWFKGLEPSSMPLRVKLYTLEQENSQPTFFDHVRVEEGDCKVILRSSAKKI